MSCQGLECLLSRSRQSEPLKPNTSGSDCLEELSAQRCFTLPLNVKSIYMLLSGKKIANSRNTEI